MTAGHRARRPSREVEQNWVPAVEGVTGYKADIMPLERFELEAVREPQGFTFLMRTIKTMQTVRVFVMNEALQGDDLISSEDNLRAQFEAERTDFEAVAREKYKRGRVAENGLIVITLADVVGSSSTTSGVSLYAAKGRGCPNATGAQPKGKP